MKKFILLLVAVLASLSMWAETKYIAEVMLIGGTKTETDELKDTYTDQGWTVIDQDLNAGCGSSSDYIYLLYKEGSTASPNHTFVTHFLISDASGTAPDTRDHNGHRYKLVPYDGGDHFKQKKGDLNSNAGGDDIHLYYTTEIMEDKKAVSQITFNATQSGGIYTFSATTGYDLNDGAGGDYIYMHCESKAAPGWDIQKSSDGSQCHVTGLSSLGLTQNDILAFPAIIDGAAVVGITGMNFSEFSGLRTIYFSQDYDASTIPSANQCRFLKNVHIVDNSGIKIKEDELPASVTSIADGAFTWTKLETLKMPNVTSIGNNAFYACIHLTNVTFPSGLTSIGNEAFFNCYALTSVTFPSGLTSIGTMAFFNCDALTSITLPSSLTSIGNKAFNECNALNSVTISGNPTMGAQAFPDATTLVLKPRTNNWDDASWTTFYNDYANFKAQGAAKVYKATVADGKVVLTEVKDKIVNAGTAVVLKTGKSNNFVQLNRTTDTSSDTRANELHAENATRYIPTWTAVNYPEHTFYLLGNNYGVGYYRYLGDMMPQNEAFLALPPITDTPQMMPIVEYQPFAITLPESFENGSVTCNKTEAAEGETVTLTVTPDDGYELENLTVATVDATTGAPLRANVDVAPGENGTYTFAMPAAPVTVSATFKKAPVITSYVDADGVVHDHVQAIPLDETMTSLGEDEQESWYVACGTLNYTQTLTFAGDVHLILADGAVMNIGTEAEPVTGLGIDGSYTESNLTIYGQTLDDDTAGHLNINTDDDCIYIDGDYAQHSGNVTLNSSMGAGAVPYDNFTFTGGTLYSAVDKNAIYNGGNVDILGGKLSAVSTGHYYGIYTYDGNVTLGWKNADDEITISNLTNGGPLSTMKIVEGQAFTDGENIYDSTTPSDVLWALTNVTLRPVATFAINVPESFEHGTVTCDKTEAAEGETVTLTVTPDDGYELENLTVTTVDVEPSGAPLRLRGGSLELTPGENGTYTFQMPAAPVTVSATFREAIATGVEDINVATAKSGQRYNLMGQPVGKDYKGIVIEDGKKRVIK